MDTPALLTRIAEALERLSPPRPPLALNEDAAASFWAEDRLQPTAHFQALPLHLLRGVDTQKSAILENCHRLANGHAAHDILLWGARGQGKSALVKACTAAVQAEGKVLHLIEMRADQLDSLPQLFALLAVRTTPAIVFVDDLGFDDHGSGARHLRSVLDGGLVMRPKHVCLYVTSNRRHIVPRAMEEQDSAINPRDVVDDRLALADRFGRSLGFHSCSQEDYLAIVAGYAEYLDLAFDPADALLWATQRGARSGRVAWHYARELAGRAGREL